MKTDRILILSMCCNTPYFQALTSTVKETWAKPLIKGKYPNIVWFGYTSCDKKHPAPCIDYDDHMIYVDIPDDLYHTYEKTHIAYKMLLDAGLSFDYVIRTNTSVYVNIDNLLKRMEDLNYGDLLGGLCGYYHENPDGTIKYMWDIIAGLFFGMPAELFEIAFSKSNWSEYDNLPMADDTIMSRVLIEKLGKLEVSNPNPSCDTIFPRYRAFLPDDEQKQEEIKLASTYIDDPVLVNQYAVVQIRTLYDGIERIEKGHEIEHFYELNNALD
jgi:hypothetical protein